MVATMNECFIYCLHCTHQINSEGDLQDILFPMTTTKLQAVHDEVREKAIENYQ